MRKVKLKINFQRMGALFCAFIVFVVGFIFFAPLNCFASSVEPSVNNEFPVGFLFYDPFPFIPDADEEIPFGFHNVRDYTAVRYTSDGEIYYVNSQYEQLVFSNGEWLSQQYRYIEIQNFPLPYENFLVAFAELGEVIYFSAGTKFELPVMPFDVYINVDVPFIANGQNFVGISRSNVSLGLGDYVRYYTDDSYIEVYRDGVWMNDAYRTFVIQEKYIPSSYNAYFALSSSLYTPPSFLDRVTSGLTAVIGWVGVVASAVISGPLSSLLGLVAVGIAVSAILLVIYLVRRFTWGA